MDNRRVLQDSVPEIEDVRAVGERVKDALRGTVQCLSSGEKCQRIEVALNRERFRQLLRGPYGIDRFVEPDRVDHRFARISTKLAAGALGKADDWHLGMPHLQTGGQARRRTNDP